MPVSCAPCIVYRVSCPASRVLLCVTCACAPYPEYGVAFAASIPYPMYVCTYYSILALHPVTLSRFSCPFPVYCAHFLSPVFGSPTADLRLPVSAALRSVHVAAACNRRLLYGASRCPGCHYISRRAEVAVTVPGTAADRPQLQPNSTAATCSFPQCSTTAIQLTAGSSSRTPPPLPAASLSAPRQPSS